MFRNSAEDILLQLVERDQERLGRVWLEEGYAAAVRQIVAEDPAWLGVYLESARRLRTDPEFKRRRAAAGAEIERAVHTWLEQAGERGELRADLPAKTLGTFLGIVVDGLAVRAAAGLELPDIDQVLALVRDATSGSR